MNTHHMQQGLKGSIAGVVAAATLLAGGILTVPHAMALEADGQYYSSKQPYVAPSEATTASYSQAPEGYETVYTESMARHGFTRPLQLQIRRIAYEDGRSRRSG